MQKKGTNKIISEISPQIFRESFDRIKGFLKKEVRIFWGEYLETC